ncbi:MAG: hypothetical protein LUG61_11490 [Lachnospiraceae bacterium]|nr:hypothetical protein [Lachnospiraceae bacterium]
MIKEVLRNLKNSLQQSMAFRILLIVEAVALIAVGVYCFRGGKSHTFSGDTLNVISDRVERLSDEDGEYYYINLEENIAETAILQTDTFKLSAGAYDIRIHYTTQVNYEECSSYSNGNGYLYFESEDGELNFDFTRFFLRNSSDSQHEYFRVTDLSGSGEIRICVSYYGLGELSVYSVEVRDLSAYRYILFLAFLLLLTCLNLFVYFLFFKENFAHRKEVGVLTLICAAAMMPFLAEYSIFGSDFAFHVNRIRLLAEEISLGNYFPAIYSQDLNGYGYATPLFYCQFFLYFPAFLYASGFSLTVAYNAYVCVISIATCLIMYYCALKIFQKVNPALLASALYTFSAWRLTNIMTRAAVGEYTAQTFLPLVFLGFYQIYTARKGEKIGLNKYWPVIVGMTGIVLSHLLSVEMTAMVILAFCLLNIRKTLEPQRFLALLKAVAFSVLVCLAQLVPMLDSMRMDINVNHSVNYIQDTGAELIQLFNSVVNNHQAAINADNTAANELSMSIGFSLTVGLLLFCVYLAKRKAKESEDKTVDPLVSVCFSMMLVLLALSTRWIPYDYLDFLPERLYSLLTVYQFPLRWLVFVVLFGSFGTAAIAESRELSSLFGRVSVNLLLVMILVLNTGQIYADQMETSDLAIYKDVSYLDFSTLDVPEYFLYGTDTSQVYYKELLYDSEQMSAGNYHYEDNQWILSAANSSDADLTVDIPVFQYDNYIAYDVETNETIVISTGQNNRIRLTIPAHYTGTIAVKYQIKAIWKLAIVISVLTDLFLLSFAVIHRNAPEKIKQ